ncbi:MAG: T9SS type A sorting domain-containing protein, partial [Bacteroidota bacterium]
ARLAQRAAAAKEDAALSLGTLREIGETVDRIKADLVRLGGLTGRVLMEKTVGSFGMEKIDLSALHSGSYLLTLKGNEKSATKRIDLLR